MVEITRQAIRRGTFTSVKDSSLVGAHFARAYDLGHLAEPIRRRMPGERPAERDRLRPVCRDSQAKAIRVE
jgi:hypothetical protein